MITMKYNAIGVVEVNFYSNAVVVMDEMLKAADIEVISCHKKLGGRMVHSVIAGQTSSVDAAVKRAKQAESMVGEGNVKVAVTISNPHPEIIRMMNMLQLNDGHKEG